MEPIEFLRILRRRWRVIVACVLICLVLALVTVPSRHRGGVSAPEYKATATLLANTVAGTKGVLLLQQDALLLTIGVVPQRAAAKLHYVGSPHRLAAQVKTTTDVKVEGITVSTTQAKQAQAELLVNTFAEQLVAYLDEAAKSAFNTKALQIYGRDLALGRQLTPIEAQLKAHPKNLLFITESQSLLDQFKQSTSQYQNLLSTGPSIDRYRLIEATSAPSVVSGGLKAPTRRSTRMLLALIVGFMLGAGIALLLEKFDLRIRNKLDTELAFGLPVISEIPVLSSPSRRRREVVAASRPISPYAEAHRILRASLMFAHVTPPWASLDNGNGNGNGNGNDNGNDNGNGDGNGEIQASVPWRPPNDRRRQVIVVTSPGSAEGKTTTVANLAAVFAESGRSVLVMSCDFHGPRIQQMLGVTQEGGIGNVLHGGTEAPSLADVSVQTTIPGVWLAPSGEGIDNPPELGSSITSLIAAARLLADIVLVDTPALLSVSAASELLPVADIALIVARSGRTTREAADRACERLERLRPPLLGVVLVGPQIPRWSRDYSGYSRPAGGWRERRKFMRRRGIRIGARAEMLEPTQPYLPDSSGGGVFKDKERAGVTHDASDSAKPDDPSLKPRWRKREARRDDD